MKIIGFWDGHMASGQVRQYLSQISRVLPLNKAIPFQSKLPNAQVSTSRTGPGR